MFPIMDSNSRVIAFGGRVMGEGEPKYLNSPETKLFDKSRNLYGLNYARRTRADHVILCEGYMDVIALHQAGFANAVASLGTALTEQQVLHLKRTLSTAAVAVLSYDSDNAGIKAARRAIPLLRGAGFTPKVLSMQPHKDPGRIYKGARAKEAYAERAENARNALLWEVDVIAKQHDLQDPAEKTAFYQETAALLCSFSEPLERNNYVDAVAREQMIPADALRDLVNRMGSAGVGQRSEQPQIRRETRTAAGKKVKESALEKSQKLLLGFMADEPQLFSQSFRLDFRERFYASLLPRARNETIHGVATGEGGYRYPLKRLRGGFGQREAGCGYFSYESICGTALRAGERPGYH